MYKGYSDRLEQEGLGLSQSASSFELSQKVLIQSSWISKHVDLDWSHSLSRKKHHKRKKTEMEEVLGLFTLLRKHSRKGRRVAWVRAVCSSWGCCHHGSWYKVRRFKFCLEWERHGTCLWKWISERVKLVSESLYWIFRRGRSSSDCSDFIKG